MFLLLSIRVAEWPPVWERTVHFNLLCVSFTNVYECVCVCICVLLSQFGFESIIWDLII